MAYPLENQSYAARIAGAFAHELCNPLQGVRSLIETISREAERGSPVLRKLERVEAGMNRLAGVLDAIRTTYENLPRPADSVTVGGFMDQLSQALKRGGASASMHYRVPDETVVYALAPELATLISHALVDPATPPIAVEVHAAMNDDYVMIDTELTGDLFWPVHGRDFRALNGHAGLPVLIQELSRQCDGDALFCFNDHGLRSIRVKLPTQL